jgi:hypothetical protein
VESSLLGEAVGNARLPTALACPAWPPAIAAVVVHLELPQRVWHACSITMSSAVNQDVGACCLGLASSCCYVLLFLLVARGQEVLKMRSSMPLAQPDNACTNTACGSQTSDED